MFLSKLLKLKLKLNFRYLKLKPGSIVLISRYNNFLIKTDNYGIKLNALNFKKLRENRGTLPLLKILRKTNKNIYKKYSYKTELHYDMLFNEFVSINNLNLPSNLTTVVKFKNSLILDGFTAIIFKKIATFHVYSFIANKFKGVANIATLIAGFRANHSHEFYFKSRPIFNFVHVFANS